MAMLRLGIPESVKIIKEELYKKSRQIKPIPKSKTSPLISPRLIKRTARSIRILLETLLVPT